MVIKYQAKMSPRKIFCDWKNSWLCLPNIFEKLNKNRLNIKNKEKNIKKLHKYKKWVVVQEVNTNVLIIWILNSTILCYLA